MCLIAGLFSGAVLTEVVPAHTILQGRCIRLLLQDSTAERWLAAATTLGCQCQLPEPPGHATSWLR